MCSKIWSSWGGDHFGFDPGAFCLNKPIRHHHFQGHFTRLTRANCNFLVTVSLSMEFESRAPSFMQFQLPTNQITRLELFYFFKLVNIKIIKYSISSVQLSLISISVILIWYICYMLTYILKDTIGNKKSITRCLHARMELFKSVLSVIWTHKIILKRIKITINFLWNSKIL